MNYEVGQTVHYADDLPAGTVVRKASGTLHVRADNTGYVFTDKAPGFGGPFEILVLPTPEPVLDLTDRQVVALKLRRVKTEIEYADLGAFEDQYLRTADWVLENFIPGSLGPIEVGSKVRLVRNTDGYSDMPIGSVGTVRYDVDSDGDYFVEFEKDRHGNRGPSNDYVKAIDVVRIG